MAMTGSISAKVTRRKVLHREAPHIRLASSSAGSIGAKGFDDEQEQERRRILQHVPDHAAIGVDVDQRVRPSPVSQRQARLMSADLRVASMPHAIAVRIGGTKNGSVISTSSAPRAGVSVRAMIHAEQHGQRQRRGWS